MLEASPLTVTFLTSLTVAVEGLLQMSFLFLYFLRRWCDPSTATVRKSVSQEKSVILCVKVSKCQRRAVLSNSFLTLMSKKESNKPWSASNKGFVNINKGFWWLTSNTSFKDVRSNVWQNQDVSDLLFYKSLTLKRKDIFRGNLPKIAIWYQPRKEDLKK